ncbi:hypothetical protein OnM2_100018 [Erysiphe neolycopersici]|uniref:Uncharacterized protein n=1 Tax=Erysiphe neolycopersici TaxID=212602 RepID=A0A420H967_9PEZI|nr:hypothetical protein OnM2_100018 [Erysiphe neolycopersici]
MKMASRNNFPLRSPYVMAGLCGVSVIFIGLKWRAVMERSEAAKRATSKDINYFVVPSRSGGGV